MGVGQVLEATESGSGPFKEWLCIVPESCWQGSI